MTKSIKLLAAMLTLIFYFSSAYSYEFEVKGINLDVDVNQVKKKSIRMSNSSPKNKIYQYCNEKDKETKDFFSFKKKFFSGFNSYRYNTERDHRGGLIGEETIAGYKISGIQYDVYNDRVVRINIILDSYYGGISSKEDANKVIAKAFESKFGTANSGKNRWERNGETLFITDADLDLGWSDIFIINGNKMKEINSFVLKQCRLPENEDPEIRRKREALHQSIKDM